MSDMAHYRGKLVLVNGEGTVEEKAKRILDEHNIEISSYNSDAVEELGDSFYKEYHVHGGELYKIEKEDVDDYEDVFYAHKNDDGTIGFVVKYYDGGCCLEEALEEAIKRLG